MIYLIKSAELLENNEFGLILKIGYTEDLRYKLRFGSYKNHNPTCEVLYTIPEGTVEQETLLHIYFYRFRKYNLEWYEYNEEILNYFESHKTKEDLDKDLLKNIASLDYKLLPVKFRRKLRNKQLEEEYKIRHDFMELYPEEKLINEKLIEFDKLTTFIEKMKLVCTTGFCEIEQERFLKTIPQIFGNYFKIIGPEKCKALKYQNDLIKIEYSRLISNQDINIKLEIYNAFQVGSKYTKFDIKVKLGEIFERCNYKATPKASELEKYFELKECLISNKETGKRDGGFEIISKKDSN